MIKDFRGHIREKAIYPLNRRLREFIGDLRHLGYQNPFNPNQIVIDDILGIEVKIDNDIVWITDIYMFDKRASKASIIVKKVFDIAKLNDIVIGILPFPAHDAGLSQDELLHWFSSLGFVRYEGKYIRQPI